MTQQHSTPGINPKRTKTLKKHVKSHGYSIHDTTSPLIQNPSCNPPLLMELVDTAPHPLDDICLFAPRWHACPHPWHLQEPAKVTERSREHLQVSDSWRFFSNSTTPLTQFQHHLESWNSGGEKRKDLSCHDMDVSKNRAGPPKWMIWGFSHIFGSTPISTKDTDIHDIMTSITICQSRYLGCHRAHHRLQGWLVGCWVMGQGIPEGVFFTKKMLSLTCHHFTKEKKTDFSWGINIG